MWPTTTGRAARSPACREREYKGSGTRRSAHPRRRKMPRCGRSRHPLPAAFLACPASQHAQASPSLLSTPPRSARRLLSTSAKSFRDLANGLDSLRCEMGERTAAGICSPVRFGVTASSNSPSRQRSGHGLQVGRQHSPSHPSSKTFLAFIPAPSQVFPPLHDADALFLPALGKHTFFTPISFASRSFSLECTLRSAATS